MTSPWAMQFNDAESLGLERLRPYDGIQLLAEEECLWVKGQSLNEKLQQSLRTLPGIYFEVWEDQQLVEAGRTVPWGYLPSGDWVPLNEWLDLQLPIMGFPGAVQEGLALNFVRSSFPQSSNVILTDFNAWEVYARSASKLRLDPLTFAVSENRDPNSLNCIVRGDPLPPIAGKHFVDSQGVAVPAGYSWSPKIDVAVLREALHLREQDLGILHLNHTWELILREHFVAATRIAVRTTRQVFSS